MIMKKHKSMHFNVLCSTHPQNDYILWVTKVKVNIIVVIIILSIMKCVNSLLAAPPSLPFLQKTCWPTNQVNEDVSCKTQDGRQMELRWLQFICFYLLLSSVCCFIICSYFLSVSICSQPALTSTHQTSKMCNITLTCWQVLYLLCLLANTTCSACLVVALYMLCSWTLLAL